MARKRIGAFSASSIDTTVINASVIGQSSPTGRAGLHPVITMPTRIVIINIALSGNGLVISRDNLIGIIAHFKASARLRIVLDATIEHGIIATGAAGTAGLVLTGLVTADTDLNRIICSWVRRTETG